MATPPPTLSPLTVGNGSLIVRWSNGNPYAPLNIKSGALTVNTSRKGDMFQIPLTKVEAYEGTYTIDQLQNGLPLENGVLYSVAYSFILEDDYKNYISNTQSAIPGNVPSNVVIKTLTPGNLKATATVEIGNNGGYKVQKLVFFIFDETTPTLERDYPNPQYFDVSNNNTNTYTVELQLDNFVNYDIACCAINNIGQSTLSNSKEVEATNLPPAPTQVTVQSGLSGNCLIRWNPSVPPTDYIHINQYKIYQGICTVDASGAVVDPTVYSPVGEVNVFPNTPDASLNFVATNLLNTRLYSFKVSAVNNPVGEGAKSDGVYGLPYQPSFMNNFAIQDLNQSLKCTWSAARYGPPTPGLPVFYNLPINQQYILDISGTIKYSGSDLSFNITGLTNGTSYNVLLNGEYTIPQVLFNKITGVSQIVSGPTDTSTGTPCTVPDSPTQIYFTSMSETAITLDWSPPYNGGSNIIGYSVYRYSDASFSRFDASYNVTITEAIITGLTTATSYWFEVYAINRAGPSLPGKAGPFMASANISAPQFVSLQQTNTSGTILLELSWQSNNQVPYTATKYSIQQCDILGDSIGLPIDVSASAFDLSLNTTPVQYTYTYGLVPVKTDDPTYYYKIQSVQVGVSPDPTYTSTPASTFINTGAVPTINAIYVDPSGNMKFTVNPNGKALNSLLVLAPPTSYVVSPVPFQEVVPNANATVPHTYTVEFDYTLLPLNNTDPVQYFLIVASNEVGTSVVENFNSPPQ